MDVDAAFNRLIQSAPPIPEALVQAVDQEAGRAGSKRKERSRRKWAIWSTAGLACAAFSFTAPGQAATGWFGGLAGIGEEPTLPQVNSVSGTQVVLTSGTLDDGTPYEVVAKNVDGFGPEGALCFQVDFPSAQRSGAGGACTTSSAMGRTPAPAIESSGVIQSPSAEDESPGLYFGIAESPRIANVEVEISLPDGVASLETTLATVDQAGMVQGGGTSSASTFVVELNSNQVASATARPSGTTVIAYDADGQVLDRRGPSVFRVEQTPQTQRQAARRVREQDSLEAGPLPGLPPVPGLGLRDGEAADFAIVNSRSWDGLSAFDAMRAMAKSHRGSTTGPMKVYLARTNRGDLAYVVTTVPDATTEGHPLLAIGIFDAYDLAHLLPDP